MRRMKRSVALFMAIIMMVSFVPFDKFAEVVKAEEIKTETRTDGSVIWYKVNKDETVTITRYLEPDFEDAKDVVIPNKVDGKKVVGITGYADVHSEYSAFSTKITSVKLPKGVKKIGKNTFKGCTNLSSVSLPEEIKSIGDSAFENCDSLKSITLPQKVTTIGNSAFLSCDNLKSISLSKNLKTIGDSAFAYCKSLKSITLPKEVKSIGSNAFGNCSSLKTIKLSSKLESIGDYAFSGCGNLTELTLPDNVEEIGEWAFYDCHSLKKIILPKNVKTIEAEAFYGCDKLKVLTIKSDKLTKDGVKDCLASSSITTIKLSGSATKKMTQYKKYFSESNSGKSVKVVKSK